MIPTVRLNEETLAACKLVFKRISHSGQCLAESVASGFLWRSNSSVFVVTCWHCVSGINPDTGRNLGTFTPNAVSITWRYSSIVDGSKTISRTKTSNVSLSPDQNDAGWHEHSEGRRVDVVAIPLPNVDKNISLTCINDIPQEERWNPSAGDEAFIVGFPEGFSASYSTPIWKRASIASEPQIDYGGRPLILLDTIGNAGLSGSPVIAKGRGFYTPTGKPEDGILGEWTKFIGIYAGRLGSTGLHSQLGRVWRADAIEQILAFTNP